MTEEIIVLIAACILINRLFAGWRDAIFEREGIARTMNAAVLAMSAMIVTCAAVLLFTNKATPPDQYSPMPVLLLILSVFGGFMHNVSLRIDTDVLIGTAKIWSVSEYAFFLLAVVAVNPVFAQIALACAFPAYCVQVATYRATTKEQVWEGDWVALSGCVLSLTGLVALLINI